MSRERIKKEIARARTRSNSRERLLSDSNVLDAPLSKTSALNERYFETTKTRTDFATEDRRKQEPVAPVEVFGLAKSKLNERYEREIHGLSETSRLNKRYLVPKSERLSASKEKMNVLEDMHHAANTSGGVGTPASAPNTWQELGLASSTLNDRYFSRQELVRNTKTDGSEVTTSRRESISELVEQQHSGSQLNGHYHAHNGSQSHHHHHVVPADDVARDHSPPSSSHASNDVIEFPEFDFVDINGEEADQDFLDDDIDASKASRTSESTRYVKYTGKQAPNKSHSHNTKAYIGKSRDDYSITTGPKSSAMSDTSEAPSLASHVKNVRIPSHTSDLDQYLDDLFNPVLDGNLDELSDARSLAASIKGGGDSQLDGQSISASSTAYDTMKFLDEILPEPKNVQLDQLSDAKNLARSLRGGGKAVGGVETQVRLLYNDFSFPYG